MDAQDFDLALGDLETRVDRLRALYENWFRGYEKAEPAVARKDVERKVYAMRKEMPRNTALRFRYNQLYLKYTTLSTYWQRTARQIEEGTYRLQNQRIKRRTEVAATVRAERRPEERAERPDGFELDQDDNVDIDGIFAQVMLDDVAKALDKPGTHAETESPPPAPKPRAQGTFARPRRESTRPPREDRATPELPLPSPRRSEPSETAKTGRPPPPAAPVPPASAAPASDEGARVAKVPPPPGKPLPGKVPPPPPPAAARPPVAPPPARPAPGAIPNAPPRAPGAPPAPPPGARSTVFGVSSNPADVAARIAAAAAAQPARPPAPLRDSAPSAPVIAVGGRAPAPQPPQPRDFVMARPRAATDVPAPAAPRSKVIPGGDTVVGRPPIRSPLDGPAINDQRLKSLHQEFNSARKRNNEGDVRFETVVQSIQKMLPELEKKHAGKRIDFEVVVKDGRVGLKPRAT